MRLVDVLLAALFTTLAGCAAPYGALSTGDSHPASADAPRLPLPAMTGLPPVDLAAAVEPGSSPELGHDAHKRGVSNATTAPAGQAQHEHDAADTANPFTCPMHPEVRAGQPGTCPKCGMRLVPREQPEVQP